MDKKITDCTLCGFCRVCPVVRITGKETDGPRAKIILQNKDKYDEVFYNCSLCHACYEACPNGVDLKLDEARVECNNKQIQTRVQIPVRQPRQVELCSDSGCFGSHIGEWSSGKTGSCKT